MIYNVATSTDKSNYEQVVTLDGEDFIIRLLWNERANHWFMTLRDSAGTDIVTGFKVVADIPFAVHCVDERIPAGQLWIVDTTGAGADPGLREFGARVRLLYADEDSAV